MAQADREDLFQVPGSKFSYHAHENANLTKLINSSRTIVADYTYDPLGRTNTSSGTVSAANTYRFSSKEFMTQSTRRFRPA